MRTFHEIRTLAVAFVIAIAALPAIGQGGQGTGSPERPGVGQGQGPGRGQGREWTEEDVKQRTKRQTEALNLSKEQEKQILDFELEQYRKNQAEMQKNQGDREKMREIMTRQREARDVKYKEVLTEEQFTQYKKNQEERMQNRPSQERTQPQGTRPDRGRSR
jgi:hypothetical protein